ncbi:MAG: endolytic transglycosylase MltG, partial [Gammaproteobacteria bacterium]|nr:endolytic transglycosylase MltG [Gammaproteobacteria bacterium]
MGKGHSWSRFTAENLILGLASLAFLITVSGSILYSLELSKKFDHLDEDDIVFVIPVGASFNLIKEILLESGVLKSSLFFSSASYLGKMTDRMQAGEYEVNAESSIRVLVRNLAVGNVRSLTLTLIEGWTFEKALSTIRSSESIITSSVDFSVSGLGIGAKDYPTSTEGMLFPDTYQYSAGTTDYEIISRANARLKDVLSSEWDKKTNDLPWKTPYDALIIASIIEKESGLINEKA